MKKREFTRISFSTKVEILWENLSYEANLRNLSYGGLFVESKTIPPKDEEISLVLSIKENVPPIKIFLKGKVIRIEPEKGFAIQYTYISPESFDHLKKLIYYNYPSPEIAEKELYRFLGKAHPLIKNFQALNIAGLKEELMKYILERAFLYNPENPFTLSSGKKSSYYLDCRKITLYSPSFYLIGSLFWQEIKYLGVEGVAGMSIGADPIVCAVLSKAYEENISLEGLLIRKEPKKYGTQKQIEGNLKEGMSIVLVEDVVTTGASVIKALSTLEKEKVEIIEVIALIDREEGGRENIENYGYNFSAFFTLSEIIKNYQRIYKEIMNEKIMGNF